MCPKDQGGDGKTKWLTDCPEGSKGRAEWNQRASGAAEAVDDPLFLLFGGLELKGGSFAAGKITGYTKHAINQAISRDGVGVAASAILDAVKNPVKVAQQAGGAVKYIGKNATVILNQAGEVVTTWARNSAGWRINP